MKARRVLAVAGVILAITAGGLVYVSRQVARAFLPSWSRVRTDIVCLDVAVKEFVIKNGGRYPPDLGVLVKLDHNGHTFLHPRTMPLDPWKREYLYTPPSAGEPRARIYSLGRDGRLGGMGEDADVDNWTLVEEASGETR